MKQKERTAKTNIVNFFGAVGYLFCFLQWFWAIMLYFSVIQTIPLGPVVNDNQAEYFKGFTVTLPGPVETAIVVFVVLAMVVLTIYILIKLPTGIAKTGDAVVHRTAESMVSAVIKAQHKKETKTQRIKMTVKLILVVKLFVVSIPVVLVVASRLLDNQPIDYSVALIIGLGLGSLSAVIFAVQYMLARVLKVSLADLR